MNNGSAWIDYARYVQNRSGAGAIKFSVPMTVKTTTTKTFATHQKRPQLKLMAT